MSTTIKSRKDLIAKLRKQASAGDSGSEIKDPTLKGEVSVPKQEHKNSDRQLPEDRKNDGHVPNLEHDKEGNNPGNSDEVRKPATKDGNKEDVSYENGELSKLASKAKSIVNRLSSLSQNNKANNNFTNNNMKQSNKQVNQSKSATSEEIELADSFTPEFHLKIASCILQTEEGRAFAEEIVKREKGVEAAAMIIKAAAEQEKFEQYSAAYNDYMQKQAAEQEIYDHMWKSASEEDRNMITKMAAAHNINKDKLKDEQSKQAYDLGAEDAAAMLDAEAGAEDIPVDAMAGEDITPEDIVMVLEELVATGEIEPEVADEILQELVASEGGMDMGGDDAELAAAAEQELLDQAPELGKVASVVDTLVK